tara:strand:+ start:345 stop:1178 length:834 start_codon:yes stop_codon:yes gene_type:complete
MIMSEDNTTVVDTGESQTVPETETQSEESISVSSNAKPEVEERDGKFFINGQRMFSKAEKDAIAKTTTREVEQRLIAELGVDNLSSVKQVVRELQSANITEGESSLDITALRNTVAKKEQTVAELKAELEGVKAQYVLDDHVGKLKDAMPSAWTPEQRNSVVRLMKADGMFKVEGQSFHIVDGDDFYTTDEGKPNYIAAVEKVGRDLGLQFSKKGVATVDAQSTPVSKGTGKIDETRLKSDSQYRDAYVTLRSQNTSLNREAITSKMIESQMNKLRG